MSDSEIDDFINSLSDEEIMNIFYIDWRGKNESMEKNTSSLPRG